MRKRCMAAMAALALAAIALLSLRAPSAAFDGSFEDGYKQGVLESCAGIRLIAPEEYDYVLNMSKKKIHKAGKACTKNMAQANTAYFAGTAEELLAAMDMLGWTDAYENCDRCKGAD